MLTAGAAYVPLDPQLPALLEALLPSGVVEVSLHRPTLDHVFLHHTGHSIDVASRAVDEAAEPRAAAGEAS